jgi:CRP-like cAMP-binding protein
MTLERARGATALAIAGRFRHIALFAELDEDELQAIAAHSTLRHAAKGDEILSFLDQSNDIFFVLEGRIQVKNYSHDGREFIYSEIAAGDVFGEFSALDGLPRSASVVAIEDSIVARMKSADFVALLRANFDLTLRLLRLLTAKARRLSDRVIQLIALSARDRVRFEISRLASGGVREGTSVIIRPSPTHYELAARVGSQREAVTRELNRLASLGYLRLSRKQIVVADLDRFNADLLGGRSGN